MFSIMYSNTLNPRQIGELSDRLNRLGALRLAATMDIEKLRRAGPFIGDIRRDILACIVSFQARKMAAETKQANSDAMKYLENAYVPIEADIAILTNTLGLDVYIESRLERSYNYIEQWRNGLKWLRIRRLEGFPSYDEFAVLWRNCHKRFGGCYPSDSERSQ